MRVLFLHSDKFPGTGGATYAGKLINALSKRHEISIYKNIIDLDKKWDIVHALNIKHFDTRLLANKNAPFIVDVHDAHWAKGEPFYPVPDWPARWILGKIRRSRYNEILEKAKVIIVHSNYVASRIGLQKVSVIPYAVEGIRAGPPLRERQPVIMFAGRDYFRKGLPVLIKAWKHVCRRMPEARLMIAGREYIHGRIYARIFARDKSIELLGGISNDNLIERMRNARAVVLPSCVESFGIVLLEAMAAGAIAVGSATGGIQEALRRGDGGLLVMPRDSRALASAIIECLEESPQLDHIVRHGFEIAAEHSVEAMVRAIEDVYMEAARH